MDSIIGESIFLSKRDKLKLGILCNFSWPHVGGSEFVIKNISERLVKDSYNYDVNVYSFSCKVEFQDKGVNYFFCKKGNEFISQIAQNDHVFVYSDSLWGFDTLLHNIKLISCKVSLCLVGAYHLQSHPESFRLLKDSIDRFNLITHSRVTPDYNWCINNGLPVKVISNGIFLQEFKDNSIKFREKYKIKEKYIILNVSSFFFGKGQDILPKICRKLSDNLDDFIIVQISNSVNYRYDKVFLNRTKQQSTGLPIRFLRDLPREDVVAAFRESDVFLFPSLKEVAPLVLLESRASKLPWVSMNIGNAGEVPGGVVINNPDIDHKGYKVVDDKIVNRFSHNIVEILENDKYREKLITEGQKDIELLDWKNIVPLYHEVFSK